MKELHPSLAHHIVNVLGWNGLRPLQAAAIEPLLAGDDALLLAPTAGGKTEAAVFPVLSAMAERKWTGLSVLYVCPLKALLNNLLPRLETYAAWVGRRVALWHGDVSASRRERILSDPPDVLLTTPESIEAMLVSTKVDHHGLFGGLRLIVVDEVHAFAGDDRGWHLLIVLERLSRISGGDIQRVGLSATVGNPEDLLTWLQGSGAGRRPAKVIAPEASVGNRKPEVELDHVGSIENAAKVIAALHRGEKRLVFCDARRIVEELGAALRGLGVTTFLSHASLSADERRRSEQAFAEARDCVIVATSTLELGIDVGDLDRVIQINSPRTVASFLQRLGRAGRRADSVRNCLFLALGDDDLLAAAGLLLLWSRGYVEPVVPPPEPRHIVAQQLLALCLQENQVGERLWREWWNGLAPFSSASADPILAHLVAEGFLERDGEMLFIGQRAEQRFGRRHFMDLTAVFTAAPEFTVLNGRSEIGQTNPALLIEDVAGPRILLLAGHSWRVTYVDWKRRRCFVEPADNGGKAKWGSAAGLMGPGRSYEMARAMRSVVVGEDPPVTLTRRASAGLSKIREERAGLAAPDRLVIAGEPGQDMRWWTWAGHAVNATLKESLGELAVENQRVTDSHLRLNPDVDPTVWRDGLSSVRERGLSLPSIDERALEGLKFSAALPHSLAEATLAARLVDVENATSVLGEPVRFLRG